MANTIQQLLGYVALQEAIETVKTGIPNPFPPALDTTKGEGFLDSGRYYEFNGTRQTARRTEYQAPHVQTNLRDLSIRDIKLVATREKITLDPSTFKHLQSYESYEVDLAKREVARQILQFKTRFENLRIAMKASMLFEGKIWFNSDGDLLPSASGAALTVDFGIPANNKNQLNGIIGTTWVTTTTDILGDIRAIKKQAIRNTGYPIRHALYGDNIPSYFANNDSFKEYLSRNPAFNQQYKDTGELPDGLLGLTWWPCYESFFEDQSEDVQSFVGVDDIVFIPDINQNVYAMIEGTTEVPTNFGVFSDAMAAINSSQTVRGMYTYATITHDPVAAHMHAGDVLLPTWKLPNGIFQADVTP